METSERGYWVDAGSAQLARWEKHRLRHRFGVPVDWRDDRRQLQRVVVDLYPDAQSFAYRGGVLRFRWNGGEGSGRAYESGMTLGPVAYPLLGH